MVVLVFLHYLIKGTICVIMVVLFICGTDSSNSSGMNSRVTVATLVDELTEVEKQVSLSDLQLRLTFCLVSVHKSSFSK